MTQPSYEIVPYRDELLYQVVILQHYLWGGNPDVNVAHFKWKYCDNPYSERPLGIVALHDGKVVGFRGYFAMKWHIPWRQSQFIVLTPTDTTVHPDHRMAGLSVAMGNMAMEEYEPQYRVFLNSSASKKSTPGYVKMGFVPLTEKRQMRRYNPLTLMATKYLLMLKKKAKIREIGIETGKFGNIEVAAKPRPAEMAAVISEQKYTCGKIRLLQDEEFFKWRFNSLRSRHIFFYQEMGNKITAYVVLGLYRGNVWQGDIVDYGANNVEALGEIIQFIAKMRQVDILSIYSETLDDEFLRVLTENGFKENSLFERRKTEQQGLLSYLVRPVKKDCAESDWYLGEYDIRNIANWELKGVCVA
jgi:hypothetical protein